MRWCSMFVCLCDLCLVEWREEGEAASRGRDSFCFSLRVSSDCCHPLSISLLCGLLLLSGRALFSSRWVFVLCTATPSPFLRTRFLLSSLSLTPSLMPYLTQGFFKVSVLHLYSRTLPPLPPSPPLYPFLSSDLSSLSFEVTAWKRRWTVDEREENLQTEQR